MIPEKVLNALKWIVTILNENAIPYQISGGFAAHLYGATRPINDIDIDIPEESFSLIMGKVKPYILDELQHYNDGKWDLQVMTLNYLDQEIDISGAFNTKVSNLERTEWISIPVDFSSSNQINLDGFIINIISPQQLIDYKKHLDGDHQIDDINAVKKYIESVT